MDLTRLRCLCILLALSCVTVSARLTRGYDCRRSNQGADYFGTINSTETGRTCQRWDSDFPHPHDFTDDRYYPEGSVSKAENFCRNPETSTQESLWCFTTDPGVEWEYCDVPKCSSYPECKQTATGEEYNGHEEVTSSGTRCVTWGPGYPDLRFNYCRNPDLKPDGPWCFTDPEQTQWEYCDVTFCKPSASCMTSSDGSRYVGTTSMTIGSMPCQRWDSNVPHVSNYTDPGDFPDETLEAAADFCRNPGSDKLSPWCYTKDPDVEWDFCDIPTCTDCKISNNGIEYAGTTSLTSSGLTCQRWDVQTPHPHPMTDPYRFPDASLQDASNYCRNPDKDPEGPWCYTSNPGVVRESCGIQFCTDEDTQPVRHVRHVLHIGVDGVHPCFLNANVTNIMDRIANQGSYTITKGRSVLPSVSMPSWTSTLCSFPVEGSGIPDNGWLPQWLGHDAKMTPVTGGNVPMPCLCNVLQGTDANVHTAMFYDWENLKYLASTGSPGRVDEDQNCRNPVAGYAICDEISAMNASAYLERLINSTERSYTFVYIGQTDQEGHDHRWCTDAYLRGISVADGLVGMMLDAIDNVGMEDVMMVVLSTDHGGLAWSHGTYVDDDLEIPVIFRGPGIKRGYEIQYEVQNIDIVPTIAYAMGYKPSPWWSGHVVDEILDGSF